MNFSALLVTGSVFCSLVYAANQERHSMAEPEGAIPRASASERTLPRQRPKSHAIAALGDGGACTIGEPLDWFTTVHVLPECADLIWGGEYMSVVSASISRTEAIDVDGDGRDDHLVLAGHATDQSGTSYFARSYVLEYGLNAAGFYTPVLDIDTPPLYRARYSAHEGGLQLTLDPVMSASVLLDALCAVTKPCDAALPLVYFNMTDFKDMDGDGDLDLILTLDVYDKGSYFTQHRVWIENTVKANPALAADINKDGVVDGKDLAAVLSAWSQ